jgi:hypothetical protein
VFTRAELEATASLVRSKGYYLPHKFSLQYGVGFAEDDWFLFRGAKEDYKDAAHFWLRCISVLEDQWCSFMLLARYRDHQYDEMPTWLTDRIDHPGFLIELYNLYQPISPESFEAECVPLLRHFSHVQQWKGQVQRAMMMCDEWNDRACIAETEHEYLVFHWETGA